MRQNSKVEPSTPSSPAIALHPVLSLTLANLDIQLEDELVRYRRQRASAGCAVPQSKRKQPSQQLDLIAVAATSDRNSANAAQPTPALEERLIGVAEQMIAPDTYKPIPAFTASPQPFEAAIALRTPPKPLTQDGSADQSSLDAEGNDAHALAHAANPNLDDYLESSEELLRSLADEQAEVQAERNFMQSLLTPLGLGSMLLLLLSSAMFGYVIMNPSSLGWLAVKQNGYADAPSGQTPGQAVLAPPQPDLAKRELPDLNLSNLGTVNVSPGVPSKASPVPSSQTAATPNSKPTVAAAKAASQPSSESSAASTQAPTPAVTSSSPSRPYVRPAALPPTVSSRSAPIGTPARSVQTAPAPSAPASTVRSRSGSADAYQYKVGVPFENDQTLENAKKVVPDAFVRTLPDGRTIVQLGAARSETEVKANVQGLRDQGLSSAEVYKR